jgi:hypothetical protein
MKILEEKNSRFRGPIGCSTHLIVVSRTPRELSLAVEFSCLDGTQIFPSLRRYHNGNTLFHEQVNFM